MKIRCPNCNNIHTVPDEYKGKQVICPGCGLQTTAMPVQVQPKKKPVHVNTHPKVQTIERTGKKYKAAMLVGGLVTILGVVGITSGGSEHGMPMVVIGLAVYFVAKVGAWWAHG